MQRVTLRSMHDAGHLVMMFEAGFGGSLPESLPPSIQCYAKLLRSSRRGEEETRSRVEDDLCVLLAGMVATQSVHPRRLATSHGTTDIASANVRAARYESDSIVRRAWLTYLRHRVRARLCSYEGTERVLRVAALLDGDEGYAKAKEYLTQPLLPTPEEDGAAEGISDADDGEPWIEDVPPDPSPDPPMTSRLIVDVMELSVRAENCLLNANIRTLEQLAQYTDRDLASLKNVGVKTREEIIAAAERVGVKIRRVMVWLD
jgi:Bacterial RNA polymerase, alpha chain C terminal domain